MAGADIRGYFLARKVLRAVYDFFYRMGPETEMTEPVMELLQISRKDGMLKRTIPITKRVQILFSSAVNGDTAALNILDNGCPRSKSIHLGQKNKK